MAKTSSWETVNPDDPFEGTSLKKRAEKRTVTQINEHFWIVAGDSKLGDAYDQYEVSLPEGERKYDCACYGHSHGQYRSRKMCSHVLAVILFRKGRKQHIEPQEPDEVEATLPIFQLAATEPPEPEKVAAPRPDDADGAYDDAAGPSGRFVSVAANTLPDEAVPVDDPVLGAPPLPAKFSEFRPHQWDAIVEIMEHLEQGKKVVMLSAPTGSGKTLIGETVRRLWGGRSVYACTTKSLQDQIQRDFDYARTIKGRSNYPTQTRADLTAEDCTWTRTSECDWCETRSHCPYRIAKDEAAHAPLPILNTAYYIAETSAGEGSSFANRDLIVIDEADTLEEQLMGTVEVVLGSYLRNSIGLKTLPKKTVAGDWVRWLEQEVLVLLDRKIQRLGMEARDLFGDNIKQRREIKRLSRIRDKVKWLLKTDDETGKRMVEEGWVMTGYEGNSKEPTIRFKPIRVAEFADEYLWSRGHQFLLMSATLISPNQMAQDLGLEDDEWAVVHLDSTFPIERRPVFASGNISMTNKTKAKAWPQMADEIEGLIADNPGVRILIHTVSYALSKYLSENIKSHRTLTYLNSQDRERTLARFLERDDAVLLAPSFERGIDLPAEDCQVIIIAKVPWPYLGDKQVAARMYGKGGQVWYAVQTIRAIVQMTGRGMRSADDWCDTYILDSQFKRIYRDNKRLFPKWWRDAVVLSMTDPKNRPLIEAMRERKANR